MSEVDTLSAARRFWWLILVFTTLGALVAALPTPRTQEQSVTRWSATHTMLVSNSSGSGSLGGFELSFDQFGLFATTGEVPARAAVALGYDGSPAALAAQISVGSDARSGAFRITTTQSEPERAVEVADVFAEQLMTYLAERQDERRQARIASMLERLAALEAEVSEVEADQAASPDDAVLAARLEALSRNYSAAFEQYDRLRTDSSGVLQLTTLQGAQPIAVIERSGLGAPRSRLTRGALGAIVGMLLGLGLATLLSRTDRRIRTRQQAEESVGIPTHAMIPEIEGHRVGELAVVPGRHDPLSDSYRALRSLITFMDADGQRPGGRGLITVVVSPGPGDGKTSVTANLASAFAEAGCRTVAVNADFRRPALSRRLSVVRPQLHGLSLGDLEQVPLEAFLEPVGDGGLSLLDLSGLRPGNPGELARATARLLPRLAAAHDHVVVDTSPIGGTAEVLELVPLADIVVMTITLGNTHLKAARWAAEMVRALTTGRIVLALTGPGTDRSSYYYNYYYNYYSSILSDQDDGRTSKRRSRRRRSSRKRRKSATTRLSRLEPSGPPETRRDPVLDTLLAGTPPSGGVGDQPFDPPSGAPAS